MLDDLQEAKDAKLTRLAQAIRHAGMGVGFAAFAENMFRYAAPEDLEHLTHDDLYALATRAFDKLKFRTPGVPQVEVFDGSDVSVAEDGSVPITIIETFGDDMAFLFGSIKNEIQAQGHTIHLVVHPIVSVDRGGDGNLVRFQGPAKHGDGLQHESLVHIHIDLVDEPERRQALMDGIAKVQTDVGLATADFEPMRARLREAIEGLKVADVQVPAASFQEAVAFLEAMEAGDFVLTGMREHRLDGDTATGDLIPLQEKSLGIMHQPELRVLRHWTDFSVVTPEVREFLQTPEPILIAKASVVSLIQRRTYLDYVGVKLYDDDGNVAGELRIVGLFTSAAYTRSVLNLPVLRLKARKVIAELGFDPHTHSGAALLNVLETYPRDELYQVETEQLAKFADAIMQLNERPRVRVLPRVDPFDRFVSILVYVPRDRFTTQTREAIEAFLTEAYDGHVSARYVSVTETTLTRLHIIIGRREYHTPQPKPRALEERIGTLIRTWGDDLAAAAAAMPKFGIDRATVAEWAPAFSNSYQATYAADRAIRDINIVSQISDETPTAIVFFRRDSDGENGCSLKIYNKDEPISLSSRVPILENMGFTVIDERTFRVAIPGHEHSCFMHDMSLKSADGAPLDVTGYAEFLQAMFIAVWEAEAENDTFNGLLLTAGLAWRDIAILRALSRYLRQATIPYGQDLIAETLNRYPAIAKALIDLFYASFDPAVEGERGPHIADLNANIEMLCAEVVSLADDTIVHRLQNLIGATLRTNVFQLTKDGTVTTTFGFKLDPSQVDGLPKPVPYREIWCYSPRVEGVHIRFGPIARGGLRWSDRPQDFRTEVLGLVKAQQVKNAVIVPVGAKGGFFPKRLPDRSQRDAWFEEGRGAYKVFIDNLLDMTDDLDGETVVPPTDVVRRDGDDPYLVVAADKGTATFSDTANGIAQDHGFWLDDAFASGGSAGYDHKDMGITARGAWESVKRHFREMNHDIQTEPFTVVGVGDMSGDVFGNGMLLSRETKLIAAFDHRDIIIDPNPDPAASYAARKTLFDKARSSWQDYDRSALSPGGGIFSRASKSIELSPEARLALDLQRSSVTPTELMRAILRAPADLMWFGGIGTYIRGPQEANLEIGDRANDAIRLSADQVRVKVIGEGANLGVSAKARVALGLNGVRLNSDAIDNSAGVNTSDVEVNIKIALADAMRSGRLTREDRNRLLEDMTDEVATLVLRNNYLQSLAISLSKRNNTESASYQIRLMETLEQRGLDREIEDLPSDQAFVERVAGGEGLTRSEIGVLLAYAKLTLFNDIVDSDLPDDPFLARELYLYFPTAMREDFSTEIDRHKLRREIIATDLCNSMINRGGPTFLMRVGDQTGATVDEIARAFTAAREAFQLTALNNQADTLDNIVSGETQLGLYASVRRLLLDATIWFIRNEVFDTGLEDVIARYRESIVALRDTFTSLLSEDARAELAAGIEELTTAGVPAALAERFVRLPVAVAALDIIVVARNCDVDITCAGAVWFALNEGFHFGELTAQSEGIATEDYYDGLAVDRARRSLAESHRRLAIAVLQNHRTGSGEERVHAWIADQGEHVHHTQAAVREIIAGPLTMSRIAVASGLLNDLSPHS
ncbi:MAG: NAD-glutamate dehydrogenase [Pseudomonadota bacterium]